MIEKIYIVRAIPLPPPPDGELRKTKLRKPSIAELSASGGGGGGYRASLLSTNLVIPARRFPVLNVEQPTFKGIGVITVKIFDLILVLEHSIQILSEVRIVSEVIPIDIHTWTIGID